MTSNMPVPNVAELEALYTLITEHPERWAQGLWVADVKTAMEIDPYRLRELILESDPNNERWDVIDTGKLEPAKVDALFPSCGTVGCLAGHAIERAGYHPVFDKRGESLYCVPDSEVPDDLRQTDVKGQPYVYLTENEADERGLTHEYIDGRAQKILGLTQDEADLLFDGDTSVSDVAVFIEAMKIRAANPGYQTSVPYWTKLWQMTKAFDHLSEETQPDFEFEFDPEEVG